MMSQCLRVSQCKYGISTFLFREQDYIDVCSFTTHSSIVDTVLQQFTSTISANR